MGNNSSALRTRFESGNTQYSQFRRLPGSERNNPTINETNIFLRNAMKHYKKAINGFRSGSLAHTHADSPENKTRNENLAAALFNLAVIKWHMYQYNINTEVQRNDVSSNHRLHEVIMLSEEALTIWNVIFPTDKPERYPTLLAILFVAFREVFTKNADLAGLVQSLRLGVTSADSGQTSKIHIEATMQIGTIYLYWRPEIDIHKDDAIRYLTDAQDLCGDKTENAKFRYTCLYNLALINHRRLKKKQPNTKNIDDLDKAITSYRTMFELPEDDARRAKGLWALSLLLIHKYDISVEKNNNDLTEARETAEKAIASKEKAEKAIAPKDILSAEQCRQLEKARNATPTSNIEFPSLPDAYLYQQLPNPFGPFEGKPAPESTSASH